MNRVKPVADSGSGPAEAALAALQAMALGAAAAAEVARLTRVIGSIRVAAPELTLTVDPVEHRGFEYQTGISFTIFARGVRGELGRGGRYLADRDNGDPESSTGFTLYMDTLLRALREAGWATLSGLETVADPRAEAKRLACSHILVGEQIEEL